MVNIEGIIATGICHVNRFDIENTYISILYNTGVCHVNIDFTFRIPIYLYYIIQAFAM